MSDLNMSHGKKSEFDSFSLFALTLVIKLRNFDFNSDTLKYFNMSDLNISRQTVCGLV